ncbi:MAG: sulfur carrier protein ThiS [Cocleimonas sp.]|nr:sulfur carrier protein ThiS [Cocleimonas sp.]
MLKITLNGEQKELPEVMSVKTAMLHWQPTAEKFAIAINGEFVPRSCYADTLLQTGDEVELLSPIVGG